MPFSWLWPHPGLLIGSLECRARQERLLLNVAWPAQRLSRPIPWCHNELRLLLKYKVSIRFSAVALVTKTSSDPLHWDWCWVMAPLTCSCKTDFFFKCKCGTLRVFLAIFALASSFPYEQGHMKREGRDSPILALEKLESSSWLCIIYFSFTGIYHGATHAVGAN